MAHPQVSEHELRVALTLRASRRVRSKGTLSVGGVEWKAEHGFVAGHKVVVARDTLKGVEPVEGWPSDHVPSLRPAGEQTFARLVAEARSAT